MDEQKQKDLNQELEELKKQCEEYLNGWKRAKADFVNYQKDETKRFEAIAQFANESIIKDLLVVLDSFELAGNSIADRGFFLIKSQLEETLKKYGLEKINVSVGQNLDLSVHESIAAVDSPDHPVNAIVEITGIGYTLHGKVIRPAKVKVVK